MIDINDVIGSCLVLLVGAVIGFFIGLWQVCLESPLPLSALFH